MKKKCGWRFDGSTAGFAPTEPNCGTDWRSPTATSATPPQHSHGRCFSCRFSECKDSFSVHWSDCAGVFRKKCLSRLRQSPPYAVQLAGRSPALQSVITPYITTARLCALRIAVKRAAPSSHARSRLPKKIPKMKASHLFSETIG